MKLLIKRFSHEENQTLGYAIVFNENNGVQYTFSTLELPWKENAKRISHCLLNGKKNYYEF